MEDSHWHVSQETLQPPGVAKAPLNENKTHYNNTAVKQAWHSPRRGGQAVHMASFV